MDINVVRYNTVHGTEVEPNVSSIHQTNNDIIWYPPASIAVLLNFSPIPTFHQSMHAPHTFAIDTIPSSLKHCGTTGFLGLGTAPLLSSKRTMANRHPRLVSFRFLLHPIFGHGETGLSFYDTWRWQIAIATFDAVCVVHVAWRWNWFSGRNSTCSTKKERTFARYLASFGVNVV